MSRVMANDIHFVRCRSHYTWNVEKRTRVGCLPDARKTFMQRYVRAASRDHTSRSQGVGGPARARLAASRVSRWCEHNERSANIK